MTDYRKSHSGSGSSYSRTYSFGYYKAQWELLEKPLIARLFTQYGGPDKSCLDFACGTGRISGLCGNYFQSVVGVDVSPSMLSFAQPQTNVKFVLRDITTEPLEQSFDVATAFRFFLNAENSLRGEALKAIARSLRPGGVLIANIHMISSSPMGLAYRAARSIGARRPHNTMSVDEFRTLLARHGFTPDSVEYYGFLPRVGSLLPALHERLVEPVERHCLRLGVPRRWAQCALVVSRRSSD